MQGSTVSALYFWCENVTVVSAPMLLRKAVPPLIKSLGVFLLT